MKKLHLLVTCLLPLSLLAQVNFIENTTISVEKLPLNTPASDFGPAFVGEELWFSSFTDEQKEQVKKSSLEDSYYHLYSSPVDEKGNISPGKKQMLDEISAGYHAGPVSFCKSTNELFLTLSNYDQAEVKNVVFREKNIPLKIIILRKTGNTWAPSGEIPFNSASYSVGHPAVSVSGDTLIFASDISGPGKGKTDLYMTVRKNGQWGEMINLGMEINTPANDMFPYLHQGKILFYASDGKKGGKGGFDIWYSVLTENGFGAPVNLGKLNSAADDFGLVVNPNEETGFFVSNKGNLNQNDDIYKVTFDGQYELELQVRDKKTMKPIPAAKIQFNDNRTFFANEQGMVERSLDKASAYTATTDIEGYMNQSVSFSTQNLPFGKIKKEILVDKAEVGQKFVLNDIYYQFDKWDILPESEKELNKLVKILKDNPSWKIELASHTDSRGTAAYNTFLSQKRSDSVVSYIRKKGITFSRIIAEGYGESQLINQCSDGVACTEEQHKENRRTEFKILQMK